eukprot:CAMPEP_0115395282 /NCGR_PEP_ID=MMETSP0271-20121206/12706_1 /TAXON_ID=71861 /ORGANISM="Scrippsiella trochoidea, Strain CCMP3099" /LENGTH=52 /DNA_ID=CAMNT_0002818989 /DNA_START=112 /DNA_END=270 /DNA_ORIENTATION=-
MPQDSHALTAQGVEHQGGDAAEDEKDNGVREGVEYRQGRQVQNHRPDDQHHD